MNVDEYLGKDTFDMFKTYADERFDRLHECDKRIEEKLDKLVDKMEAKQEKKAETHSAWRIAVVAAVVGSATVGFFEWLIR